MCSAAASMHNWSSSCVVRMLRHSSNPRNMAVTIPQAIRRYIIGPVSVSAIVTSVEPCHGACPEEGRAGKGYGIQAEYSTADLKFHCLASGKPLHCGHGAVCPTPALCSG